MTALVAAILLAQAVPKPPVLTPQDPMLSDDQIVDARGKPRQFGVDLISWKPFPEIVECLAERPFGWATIPSKPQGRIFDGWPNFEPPITVATAAGAKVRRIVVQQIAPNWPRKSEPFTWSDFTQVIRHVWSGKTRDNNGLWAERVAWTIRASIEFEDGKKTGCLATDGFHVSMSDSNGEGWLFRLDAPSRSVRPPTKSDK